MKNCSLVFSYLHKLNQSVHFCEVINNAGCRHLLPDLFVIAFEIWFQKFIRSLIWIPALLSTDWMIRVSSTTILNLIFCIDEVDVKTIIWIRWWLVIETSLLNRLQCFITCEGHANVR